MRALAPLLVIFALLSLAAPTVAQTGTINMGVWVTVDMTDVADFEEAAAEHAQWHADQGDTWGWPAYQAMSGSLPQYVFVTPNHEWADFDMPTIDMSEDAAQWGESGAEYSTSETVRFWEGLPEISNPPADPTAFPVVMVIEFTVTGDEAAILLGAEKFKEASQGQGTFGWSRSIAQDGPPVFSIAIWYSSFAAMGNAGPTPEEVLTATFGATEAEMLGEAFLAAATPTSSTIYLYRPDLSYIPG